MKFQDTAQDVTGRRVGFQLPGLDLQFFGQPDVVCIQKCDQLTGGMLDAPITGGTGPLVFLADDLDAGIGLQDFRCIVC